MSNLNMKMEIKLGQKLYKYATFYLMEYEVFGILQREEGEYYQVRCNSCKHGTKCEVLLKFNDQQKLIYVSMLNEDEEDKQYYWHVSSTISGAEEYYHFSKKDALTAVLGRAIKSEEESIKKFEENIKRCKETILKHQEYLKGIEE